MVKSCSANALKQVPTRMVRGSNEWPGVRGTEVVRQDDEAARTVAVMQVTGHGIPATTLSEFTSATDAFLALDASAKARYRCPPGINRGYTPR
jgi:isopenicillin N synthase-like dioxygenase